MTSVKLTILIFVFVTVFVVGENGKILADKDVFQTQDLEESQEIDYCKEICGNITCEGNTTKKDDVKCVCGDENLGFDKIDKTCKKKCNATDDCHNEGECKSEENTDYSLCRCKGGTTGDTCDTITDCVTGKFKYCKGDNGHCTFKYSRSVCECSGEKKLSTQIGYCTDMCDDHEDCKGPNRKCNSDKLCVCKEGYEDGDCKIITGCDKLEEKCKEIDTKCILDDDTKTATCECEKGYTYDPRSNFCRDRYCYPNPCRDGHCVFDDSLLSGFCQCSENKFYNYETNRCEDIPDKCSLMKSTCGPNEVCYDGKCICKYSQDTGEECKPKLCEKVTCLPGGKCSEEDGFCYCEKGKYYKDRKCHDVDGKCVLESYKTNCTCPTYMERKNGSSDCVPKNENDTLCSQECGYGLCVRTEYGRQACKCFEFAVMENGKCVLNKKYCIYEKLQKGSMKCDCRYGEHKQAKDGITCQSTTCADMKSYADGIGAICKMDWTEKTRYDPDRVLVYECPIGYDSGDLQICTDPCSIPKNVKQCSDLGMLCYNSVSSPLKFDCKCPPTVPESYGKCSRTTTDNVYLIENIPVLKKKYELKSDINKAVLNKDLIQSMKAAFGTSQFEYGYLYDYKRSGGILLCSFWITFKEKPADAELLKIKLLPKKFNLQNCDNCDAVVLPPSLLLGNNGLKEAKITRLAWYSDKLGEMLCGKGASMLSMTCVCDEGYRIIPSSAQTIGSYDIRRCEDIDECAEDSQICPENTECVNTLGSYRCDCKPGFQKEKVSDYWDPEQNDKSKCVDMCTPSPCKRGKCSLNKDKSFNCQCKPGFGGSICDRLDKNYASAKKSTAVVGAVLGILLALAAVGFLYYINKIRKNSGSEDAHPAQRTDRAEMAERRPVNGISNRGYE